MQEIALASMNIRPDGNAFIGLTSTRQKIGFKFTGASNNIIISAYPIF